MNTLANFIKTAMDDQNKYFTLSGFSENESNDNYKIYATSNLGNKLKEMINEINILDLKYIKKDDLKVIIIFILILKMFSLIIGQLLVEEYARIILY